MTRARMLIVSVIVISIAGEKSLAQLISEIWQYQYILGIIGNADNNISIQLAMRAVSISARRIKMLLWYQ